MDMTAARHPAVFTPDAVTSINKAYAQACRTLEGEARQEEIRYKLADHIMLLARNGETDERRLCVLAVEAISGKTLNGDLTSDTLRFELYEGRPAWNCRP